MFDEKLKYALFYFCPKRFTAKYRLNDLDENNDDFVWPEESIINGCKFLNV